MMRFILTLAAALLLLATVWAGIDHFAGAEARKRRFVDFWVEHGQAVTAIEQKYDVDAMHGFSKEWRFCRSIPFSLLGGTSETRQSAAKELTALDSRIVIEPWERIEVLPSGEVEIHHQSGEVQVLNP